MRESGENYLETILMLQMQLGNVRQIDIANELGYSKPSVSRAVNLLKEGKYVAVDKDRHIKLTKKGEQKAKDIYKRHVLIREFLIHALGLDAETADVDACRIEHVVSQKMIDHMRGYMAIS